MSKNRSTDGEGDEVTTDNSAGVQVQTRFMRRAVSLKTSKGLSQRIYYTVPPGSLSRSRFFHRQKPLSQRAKISKRSGHTKSYSSYTVTEALFWRKEKNTTQSTVAAPVTQSSARSRKQRSVIVFLLTDESRRYRGGSVAWRTSVIQELQLRFQV